MINFNFPLCRIAKDSQVPSNDLQYVRTRGSFDKYRMTADILNDEEFFGKRVSITGLGKGTLNQMAIQLRKSDFEEGRDYLMYAPDMSGGNDVKTEKFNEFNAPNSTVSI